MKRIFALALALVMACGLLVVPAAAADEDVTFTVGEWTQTGNTGSVTVTVTGKSGAFKANGLGVSLKFNKDVLTFTGSEVGAGMTGLAFMGANVDSANTKGVANVAVYDGGAADHDLAANAAVVTYSFEVKANVESCEVDFELDPANTTADHSGGAYTSAVVNGKAAVKGAPPTLDTVALTGSPVTVNGTTGGTVTAKATSTSGKDITGFVTWTVTPADQGVTVAGNTVTVDAKAKAGDYTVTATPKDGESQGTAKTATLTVTRAAAAATTVKIAGDAIIAKPTTGSKDTTYTATVTDQYGDTMTGQTITWTNDSTLTGVTVADNKVTVTNESATGEFKLTATVGDKKDEITVKVVDILFEGTDAGVTVKEAPVYGDTWGDIVKVDASKITAKVGADTVTGTYTVKDATVAPAAGEHTYEVTFTSTDEAYKDMPVASGKVTVAKKPVTVTANDVTVKIGGEIDVAEFTYTVEGLLGEDELTGTANITVNGKPLSATVVSTEEANEYVIAVSGLTDESGNYDVQFVDGTLTVRKKNTRPPAIGTGTKPGEPTGGNQPVEPDTKIDFVDVADEDWFAEAVDFVVTKGLFKGVSETEFAPNNDMTRAMVATVLYRLDGEHKTDVAAAFEDLAADTWYTDGVAWAAEKGVVKGLSETEFAPDANVTREQLATMLYRYAGEPEVDAAADMAGYADVETVSDWAETAMRWAVENGIIKGKDGSRLDPQGNATRAEVATMLQRFVNLEK